MNEDTFRSKLVKLVQKSRKALHLYTSIAGTEGRNNGEYSELQLREWKSTNTELLRQLTSILDNSIPRKLNADVALLQESFYREWRATETRMHKQQLELIAASEASDFVKAALLAEGLVSLKAKLHATHAAQHEIKVILEGSGFKITPDKQKSSTVERNPQIDRPDLDGPLAMPGKVIPMRRRV